MLSYSFKRAIQDDGEDADFLKVREKTMEEKVTLMFSCTIPWFKTDRTSQIQDTCFKDVLSARWKEAITDLIHTYLSRWKRKEIMWNGWKDRRTNKAQSLQWVW